MKKREGECQCSLSQYMNARDVLRLGVPLGEAARRPADFVAKFIPGGGRRGLVDLWVKHVTLRV